jgi:O-antigen ligase
MSYGLDFLLPSYIGIYIARRISNKKWAVPLEIVCFIFAFLFANRSVFLSIITLWIVIELLVAKNNYKKTFKIVSIFSLLTISFYYISDILNLLSKLLNNFGIYSYSITRMYNYFSGVAGVTLLSGRLEIWGLAMDVISNNILVGLGTGYFQSEYSMYTHNIFLDILIQYGIIGLIIFITLTINSIKTTLNSDKYVRLLGLMFFCLWFPKLFLSLHFYRDIGIWCFIAFGFLKSNRQNKIHSTS